VSFHASPHDQPQGPCSEGMFKKAAASAAGNCIGYRHCDTHVDIIDTKDGSVHQMSPFMWILMNAYIRFGGRFDPVFWFGEFGRRFNADEALAFVRGVRDNRWVPAFVGAR
jgi:hypothetical protein